MAEFVTLVDENDTVIGSKDRNLLTDDDRWRIVTIWVTNPAGQVLLAQRAHDKRTNPGRWGPAAAGTVEFDNDYDSTAARELEEELGVNLPLQKVGLRVHKSDMGERACMFYRAECTKQLDEFTPQPEEVEQIAWVDSETLWHDVEINPDKYLKEFMVLKEVYGP